MVVGPMVVGPMVAGLMVPDAQTPYLLGSAFPIVPLVAAVSGPHVKPSQQLRSLNVHWNNTLLSITDIYKVSR